MEYNQQIIFAINNTEYGLNVDDVLAIEPLGATSLIPNSPDYIIGMTNLRGEVLTVISLRRKFGFEEIEKNEHTKMIVTSCNGTKYALKVDEVRDIVNYEKENVHEVPAIIRSEETEFILNILHYQDRLILLIDPGKLLRNIKEVQELNEEE